MDFIILAVFVAVCFSHKQLREIGFLGLILLFLAYPAYTALFVIAAVVGFLFKGKFK